MTYDRDRTSVRLQVKARATWKKTEEMQREDPDGERFKPEKHIFYCNVCSREISPDQGERRQKREGDEER